MTKTNYLKTVVYFHIVCHLPTIFSDESWLKEFLKQTVFLKITMKRIMVPSIPLLIFKFCTTKNLFKLNVHLLV